MTKWGFGTSVFVLGAFGVLLWQAGQGNVMAIVALTFFGVLATVIVSFAAVGVMTYFQARFEEKRFAQNVRENAMIAQQTQKAINLQNTALVKGIHEKPQQEFPRLEILDGAFDGLE